MVIIHVKRNMTSRLLHICLPVLTVTLTGCNVVQDARPSSHPFPTSRMRDSVVSRIHRQVQPDIERYLPVQHAAVLDALAAHDAFPGAFPQRLALLSLTDPWSGFASLERQGLLIAELAASGPNSLPALIDVMEAGMDRTAVHVDPLPFPGTTRLEGLLTFLTTTLTQASDLREQALRNLGQEDRQFLFAHAGRSVERFAPHVASVDEDALTHAKDDHRFVRLLNEQVDYASLIAAAQALTRLANDRWLELVQLAFRDSPPLASPPAGVTGDVRLVMPTSIGMIVVGGPGPNTYDVDTRIGLILDLGGNDTYRGLIASARDAEQGISVVIDVAGNDTYSAAPLGLATGRLGVGLLVDLAGDDVYQLAAGAGGTGFGGLGILYDRAGNDVYRGSRFTQGSAIGGLGLLLDEAGDDRYIGDGYAVGFGGPSGVGAVLDVGGNDVYRCGEKYPSDYNATDAPNAKPGDPAFQYDCFGLGTGSGKRIFSRKTEHRALSLAGGWGLLIDSEGHDRYHSSNFSQGTGYFFGIGIKLDLDGDDEHTAARYGHAAGAHGGVALFADWHGDDRYDSTGPFYNSGVAWDRSVTLFVDAGQGSDVYDLRRSTGLGRADHRSWSLFVDEGGRDRYAVPDGMGMASDHSVSGFFDLAGKDEYMLIPTPPSRDQQQRGNARTILDRAGGLFIDR